MKILTCEQGSEAWQVERLNSFCASEAPMMMGVSKHMSRNQLLDLKKGWEKNPTNHFTQKIFDKGHETEARAREIVELYACESYPPIVGVREVKGMRLLASFDGLEGGKPGELVFEHKQWNAVLAENVRNGTLEPSHYWQLEQHCLVNGCETVLFVCSDGGEENRVTMNYSSVPSRQQELIAGWKQFAKDLEAHEIEAKQEAVVGQAADEFPIIKYEVAGSIIKSNIAEALPLIKARAEREMSRTLETDQDFADKENLNKATKAAREKLKIIVSSVKGEFVSFSEFADVAAQIDSVLQKMQSAGEKQVKDEKHTRKLAIEQSGHKTLDAYIASCDAKISPLSIRAVNAMPPVDFISAIKGKRNLEAIQGAVDDVIATAKIEIDQVMARVVPNQIYMREHGAEFKFLFADVAQIINQDIEPFQAIVKSRIADHKVAEEEKAEALRERIRKEEEQKATEKVEREAAERKPVEEEKVVTPDPAEEIKFSADVEVKPTGEVCSEQRPNTFLDDIALWKDRFNIPDRAIYELTEIMRQHGI